MVFDPVFERSNTGNNTPAYIYYSFVEGDNIVLHFAPKGGGSENMSSIAMLKPAQGKKGLIISLSILLRKRVETLVLQLFLELELEEHLSNVH